MKKLLFLIFVLVLMTIAACQQAAEPAAGKKEEAMQKIEPQVETTGDAAVDAVGNDLNNVNSVEKDLGADELGDLDSGLSDIQNI